MSIIAKICSVDGCEKTIKGKGLCAMHWARLNRHGDVNYKSREYHGLNRSPENIAWKAMKQRCYYKPGKEYDLYGGRGIIVCDRWLHSFSNFLEDMGKKPSPKHSLDRIDTNGNYTPENCKWSTTLEQMNNTSRNRVITYKGETKTLPEWSRTIGIKYGILSDRIYFLNWSIEKAFTTPIKALRQAEE